MSVKSLEEEFYVWQKDKQEERIIWLGGDNSHNRVSFLVNGATLFLYYPSKDYKTYFLELNDATTNSNILELSNTKTKNTTKDSESCQINKQWISVVNEFIITNEKQKDLFSGILDMMQLLLEDSPPQKNSKKRSNDSAFAEDRKNEKDAILYWAEVESQIEQAQELCGSVINYKKGALVAECIFDLHEILTDHAKISKFFAFSLNTAILTLEIDFSIPTSEGMPKITVTVQQDFHNEIVVNVSQSQTLRVKKGSVAIGGYSDTGKGWRGRGKKMDDEYDMGEYEMYDEDGVKVTKSAKKSITTNESVARSELHLSSLINKFIEDNWFHSFSSLEELGFKRRIVAPPPPAPVPPPSAPTSKAPSKRGRKKSSKKSRKDEIEIDYEMVSRLESLGFERERCIAAVEKTNNEEDEALDLLLKGEPVNENVETLCTMGFDRDSSKKALSEANNSFDMALEILMQSATQTTTTTNTTTTSTRSEEKTNLNLFVNLVAHVKHYLQNFNQYCAVCFSLHGCNVKDPVVCCNERCLSEYEEMRELGQFTGCCVCPFVGCMSKTKKDLNSQVIIALDKMADFAEPAISIDDLMTSYNHKYLPRINLKKLSNHYSITKITNIMKPDIVARFEKKWKELAALRGEKFIKPEVVFHGTRAERVSSICEKGLLVPGTGTVTHATDKGYYGKGIYLSPQFGVSASYASGTGKLFICSVLMGKSHHVQHRKDGSELTDGYDSHKHGGEWIVFDCAQVLPCFLIEFSVSRRY